MKTFNLKTPAIILCQALLFSLFWAVVPAQGQEKKKEHVVTTPKITTSDNQSLQLLYYKWEKMPETPVVVLLHMKRSNHLVWKNGFGDTLAKAGYAVIAMDFRKHSGSTTPSTTKNETDLTKNDYLNMIAMDMEALKGFIYEEHQAKNLNMAKMAIVAPEMSAPIALNWTSVDWLRTPHDDAPTPELATPRGRDVRALVLISPMDNLMGVTTTNAIRDVSVPSKNIGMLFLVGNKDAESLKTANAMYQLSMRNPLNKPKEGSTEKSRIELKSYPYKFKGTDLFPQKPLSNLTIEKDIIEYLDKHVKALNIPWQDRRSRVNRN